MIITEGHYQSKWVDLPYVEIEHEGRTMRFAATGSSSVKRVKRVLTKEPITIAWIDTFKQGETLYDIGANVGMYTIYAAAMRGTRVYAFEPEALNYAELNKNIFLNDFNSHVLAYCLALSDVNKVDQLLLSDFGYGISYHDFQENSWAGDKQFSPDWFVSRENRKTQGCIGMRLDSLLEDGLPVPDHVKIDVDGLEHRVIHGMRGLLHRSELKTVLLEVNFDAPANLALIDEICAMGWRFSWNQLRCARVKFTVDQIIGHQKAGTGGLNYIFYRDKWYDEFFDDYFERYEPPESKK
ncbi:MAG TPA: FkbM family methyltransferase [Caulobacteraceae bacterium]